MMITSDLFCIDRIFLDGIFMLLFLLQFLLSNDSCFISMFFLFLCGSSSGWRLILDVSDSTLASDLASVDDVTSSSLSTSPTELLFSLIRFIASKTLKSGIKPHSVPHFLDQYASNLRYGFHPGGVFNFLLFILWKRTAAPGEQLK